MRVMNENEVKLIKNRILANKMAFESILNKPKEQLGQDDIIKYKEAKDENYQIGKVIFQLEKRKNEIEKILSDIEIKMNEFPLLGKEDIIGEEEEESLKNELEVINTVIEDDDLKKLEELKMETFRYMRVYKIEDFKRKILEPTELEIVYCTKPWERGPMTQLLAENLWEINGQYKHYDECSLEEKQSIREYDEEIKKIRLSKDEKYDKKGIMRVCLKAIDSDMHSETIELELTPRQMAEAGILYNARNNEYKIQWKSNEQIEIERGLRARDPKTVKSVLLNGDSQIVYVYTSIGNEEHRVPQIAKAMPKKLFELSKFDIGMPGTITIEEQGGGGFRYKNEYTTFYPEMISERSKRLEQLTEKVRNDKKGKYDKIGVISIPVYTTNDGQYRGDPMAYVSRSIKIEISQRELIEAGIFPEEFKWKTLKQQQTKQEKAKVSPEAIGKTEMGLEAGLTTTEIGGFKGFMKKLLDKFKGKGEK